MLSAVIFDLDGTLVDLLDLHLHGFQEVVREGWDLDFKREDVEKYYGRTAEDIVRPFFEKHNVSGVDYKDFAGKRRSFVVASLKEGCNVKVLPGAVRLLDELKNTKIKIGLGTSSTKDMTDEILKSSGLAKYFQMVVTREMVSNGKPAPDIFLKAAKLMNVQPGECAVIEDSVYGLEAGKAAGMKIIAVLTGTQSQKELLSRKPDLLVETLEELRLEDIKAKFNIYSELPK